MNKVLILGSGSFAGSSLVDFLLNKNYKIIGVNRSINKNKYFLPFINNRNKKNLSLFKININKKNELIRLLKIIKNNKIDYIVDFLGQGMVSQSWDNPNDWIQTNVLNKLKIIESIIKKNIKIKKYIRISTPEVYGSNNQSISEKTKYNPSTPYAVSHATIDTFMKIYFKQYKFPFIIGRFSNFYGEHQQLYRLIPKTILCIIKKKKMKLEGNGLSKRNFIYREDFCNGIYSLIKNGKINNVYHFSGKKLITIKNIIQNICKIAKYDFKKLIIYTKERRSLDKIYKLNTSKTKKLLGWEAKHSLDDGLKKTFNYILENYKLIRKEKTYYIHKN